MRNNISPYYQLNFGNTSAHSNFTALTPEQQQALTQAKDNAQTRIENNPISRVAESAVKPKSPLKTAISLVSAAALLFGLGKGVNLLVRYNKFHWVSKPFDWIGKTKFAQKAGDVLQKPIGAVKKLLKKSKTITSLHDHLKNPANRSRPKNMIAKSMLPGTSGEAMDSNTDIWKKLYHRDRWMPKIRHDMNNPANADRLSKWLKEMLKGGAEYKEKKVIKKILKDMGQPGTIFGKIKRIFFPKAAVMPTKTKGLLENLVNKYPDNKSLVKELTNLTGAKEGSAVMNGLLDDVAKIAKDDFSKYDVFPEVYNNHIRANFTKNGKGVKMMEEIDRVLGNEKELNTGGILTRMGTSKADRLKKYAILQGDGAETKLGGFVQKIVLRGSEAITNGITAPTLMSFLMGLGIYKSVFDRVQEAPKGEKLPTFAEEATYDMGSYMLIPAAGGIVYKAASLNNWGATAAKGGTWLQKLVRLPAKILNAGLGPTPQTKKGILGFFQGIPRFFKSKGGGALRFLATMAFLTPFLVRPIVQISHAIFGRPTKSVLDKDKPEPTPQEQPQAPAATDYEPSAQRQSDTNLLDLYKNRPNSVPQQTSVTQNTQQEITQISGPTTNRTYIPGSTGVTVAPPDLSAAQAAINRSMAAEKRAIETLAIK